MACRAIVEIVHLPALPAQARSHAVPTDAMAISRLHGLRPPGLTTGPICSKVKAYLQPKSARHRRTAGGAKCSADAERTGSS